MKKLTKSTVISGKRQRIQDENQENLESETKKAHGSRARATTIDNVFTLGSNPFSTAPLSDITNENDRVETTLLGSSQSTRTIQKKIGYNTTSYKQYLKSQPNLTADIGPSTNCTVLNEEVLTVYIDKSNMDDKNEEDEVDDQNIGLKESKIPQFAKISASEPIKSHKATPESPLHKQH
ncbi:hypothetical protein Fot_55715 [Forsythia ovata]|uniref:Uncharacterized protein n=1 Tax=Forsythia ovata TaxID=205694 RepID=A0ABD1P3K9_9LAMI